ncbi:MAG: hypothetical protein R3A79_08870 [Nannocystaceae bacterium]
MAVAIASTACSSGQAVGGIATLASALGDEDRAQRPGPAEQRQRDRGQIAEGKGLVGALLLAGYVQDFGATLRNVRNTAAGLDSFVGRAKSSMKKVDENLQPLVDDGRAVIANLNGILGDLKNPDNKSVASKLLYDPDGKMVAEIEDTIAGLNKVVEGLEKGEGTMGKLLKDPKAYDDLVKILGNIERNNTVKRLVRFVVEKDEAASSAAPTTRKAD